MVHPINAKSLNKVVSGHLLTRRKSACTYNDMYLLIKRGALYNLGLIIMYTSARLFASYR